MRWWLIPTVLTMIFWGWGLYDFYATGRGEGETALGQAIEVFYGIPLLLIITIAIWAMYVFACWLRRRSASAQK